MTGSLDGHVKFWRLVRQSDRSYLPFQISTLFTNLKINAMIFIPQTSSSKLKKSSSKKKVCDPLTGGRLVVTGIPISGSVTEISYLFP